MQTWTTFVHKQEQLLGQEAAARWLHPLKVVHFDSGNLYLEAKDAFQLEWFEEQIRPLLKSQLLNPNGRSIKVHLTLANTETSPGSKGKGKTKVPPLVFFSDKLDPVMTLHNFVARASNAPLFRLVSELTGYNAALDTFEKPTLPLATFNPLYLWGPSGCGKTHLLMALTHAFKAAGLNALYARTETFTEHVVAAIRNSDMHHFRKLYRHVDILLIDDVHQLSRKYATQEEFFHTFNTLHSSGRQIVLAANCPPSLLEEIEPRLTSRFEWGINLHFEKLGIEDLKGVLQARCHSLDFPLSEEASAFLLNAFHSTSSLYCALEALILRCHLEKKNVEEIDPPMVESLLADLIKKELSSALSPEKIHAAVAAVYGIRIQDLVGKSQHQEISLPRQVAMYLCREELRLPFQAIGRLFERDHSTVMTSVKLIEKKLHDVDKELLTSLAEIRRHLT
jgi:chromosomal replication initiator protein